MTTIEILLLILVILLSLGFILMSVISIIILLQIKQALDKVDNIVKTTEEVTREVGISVKAIVTGIAALVTKNLVGSVAKKVAKLRGPKRS
ncbi:MAG: hypothetical protein US86_C0001G0389 [Candidatus Daviesbacteria bacterium GW2011_GWA2_38_24]|uniref:DUF948 domain-containing protein n=1 Tax=Candidatus Daviesbacteria bacterium GW2011_GWA2_38_24 TaxID=1618422 RepID=A0A0G0JKR6_9BACT|nr:MAG: hypothetical protein US86_C0001G0389 [Candidatus Daviesbacteria bacterium GW2011_GWA2_38_24]KKQ78281.1 MAG: hypothetical protein UT01_C0075G0006 [Candidatus Daviesbacteria bacterium GW2011_GWA1_38_7]OGE23398.1 MAG: hypothetical protein A2688_01815 [Candidatus Daviesbacteria bacterium RIFCSPHIGHO2_01_FULL_38_8]